MRIFLIASLLMICIIGGSVYRLAATVHNNVEASRNPLVNLHGPSHTAATRYYLEQVKTNP